MSRPPDTRDRLIEVARQLFWEKGYQATSVAEILAGAGANSGSLYHHFDTKQDLLVAVLERYRDGIGPMLLEPAWRGIVDPIEKILALLGGYRRQLLASDFRLGCPIGNLALEIAEPDPPVRDRIAGNFDRWTDAVVECLASAELQLPDGVSPRAQARLVLAAMEGAVMLARSYRDIAPFDEAIESLRAQLEAFRVTRPAG